MKAVCILVATFFTLFGYGIGKAVHAHEYMKCGDYLVGQTLWVGYLASSHSETRCFWRESSYPWRVREGLVD